MVKSAGVTVRSSSAEQCAAVTTLFDEASFTATHIVADRTGGSCAIIDSVLGYDAASGRLNYAAADAVGDFVLDNDLTVEWQLETHAHADHLSAAPYLQQMLGGKIGIGRGILTVQTVFGKLFNAGTEFQRDGSEFDRLFDDGDRFAIGTLEVEVLHLPGHTPADVGYVIVDAAFPGDTIFMPDYGTARADFPGGDARLLYRSIRRLLSLPPETRLFVCHDYKAPGRDEFAWETTVAVERASNVHVHDGVDEDAFVAMRMARDAELAVPGLMLPAIQVNMRGGHLPPPEPNGKRYLKIPIDGA